MGSQKWRGVAGWTGFLREVCEFGGLPCVGGGGARGHKLVVGFRHLGGEAVLEKGFVVVLLGIGIQVVDGEWVN